MNAEGSTNHWLLNSDEMEHSWEFATAREKKNRAHCASNV
jgi:hypothetical protein